MLPKGERGREMRKIQAVLSTGFSLKFVVSTQVRNKLMLLLRYNK